MAIMATILHRRRASLAVSGLIALNACGGGNHGGTATYTVGGSVSGLAGSGLILQDNGADGLPIAANGAFTFKTALMAGTPYAVKVSIQPTNPTQVCTVANGSGTLNANASGVAVSCITQFAVGGMLSGLSGSGLVLQNNGGERLPVAANGAFSFTTLLAAGAAYSVTVSAQPNTPGESCAVANGSGTVSAAVTTVAVTCVSGYAVGGSVSGLTGSGLVLQNNGGDNLKVAADGAFSFASLVAGGAAYKVTVLSQPTAPAQNCALANANGVIANSNVANVTLVCRAIGRFAYVANGLSNNVSVYAINPASGALAAIPGSPFAAGTYPYSVAVDPTGKFAYVANLISNNISAFVIDAATGSLTPVNGSPFAAGMSPKSVAVNPNGNLLYVANASSGNVSSYTIDRGSGALSPAPGSPFTALNMVNPGYVSVDPTGHFVYVADNFFTVVFAFASDLVTGALTPVAGNPIDAGLGPTSIIVSPNGGFAYVSNVAANTVSAFAINPGSGALTTLAASPFAVMTPPEFLAIGPT
jgi:6-phosphogluconolactonase (cycloisomerase 2 family)